MDWHNQYFAALGEGGHHANENAAVIAWGSGTLVKPVSATNIEVVKKTFLSPGDIRETRGKPTSPPGQDKKNGSKEKYTATGVLGPLAAGIKYALVIGICDYPGTNYDLCESDGDSLHMFKALTTFYDYNPDNIYLFKDMGKQSGFGEVNYSKPTRNNIYSAIIDIKSKAKSGDEVTFFFSGHGAKGNYSDDNATDTASGVDLDGIDEAIFVHGDKGTDTSDNIAYIWDGELRSWFSGFTTSRIAFVFDTCLAGGMNDVADIGRVVSMATDETHSAYVYSTTREDVDGDGTGDGEGVFTHYFANEGMLQGLADGYNQIEKTDDDVTVEEAFDYAKKNIPHSLKHRQKPVISDNFTGDLLL